MWVLCLCDPPYDERSIEVIRDLVEEMSEARDAWLDNRNAEMWTHEDDVAKHLMVKEEVRWMKKLLCVAVGIICILFAMLVNTWLL